MLGWKEIVQDYIIRHSDRIGQVTRPLREHFKIAYFTYHRIDRTGKYTVLLDRPDWAERYVNEKLFLLDPYMRHPDVYLPGFCFVENHGTCEYRKKIITNGKAFDLDQGLLLIEKDADSVEFFGFAGKKTSCALDRLYLNHPWIFRSFAAHFKKQVRPVLLQMEEEAGSLIDLKGSDFHCPQPVHPDLAQSVLHAYLKDLGKGSAVDLVKRLSLREKQCMKLLTGGKSAKETALILGLSRRTVESYFENIKNKLSCSSKQELFSLSKSFEELKLLP